MSHENIFYLLVAIIGVAMMICPLFLFNELERTDYTEKDDNSVEW